jgi:UDP:flavonoid glycosyltransferase YjiC (YdhE family)
MKVAIVINGTRGDVQPMLALAMGLKEKGHEVIFCAPPGNEGLFNRYDFQYVAFGPNYQELFKQNSKMKGGATKAPSPKEMKVETGKQIDRLGLGPNACDFKKITANAISSAILECVANVKYKKNAMDIFRKLQNSNGLALTIELIEKDLIK